MNNGNMNTGEQKSKKRFNKALLIHGSSFLIVIVFALAIRFTNLEPELYKILVAVVTILTMILLGSLSWLWYKTLDEFERDLHNQASSVAFITGILITVPYTIFNVLGWAPEVKPIDILSSMSLIWIVYYYGKKFLDR